MFNVIRTPVLRFLRVPHDPDPPAGAPGSVRVFRAGRNFWKLRLIGWSLGQLGALAGIIFSLVLLSRLQTDVAAARGDSPSPAGTERTGAAPVSPASSRAATKQRPPTALQRAAERWPGWLLPLLTVAEFAGILIYLVQIPFTYALARLDYELRWYMVTDRSLRIRSGLTSVLETTMSFANIQQVVVSQGPLQRLLGLADVRVQSAGGGNGGHGHERSGASDSLHSGVFRGVDNATQIRDLILERLRRFRAAGLGDPDDAHGERPTHVAPPPIAPTDTSDALAAAHALLDETRALRRAVADHT